MGGHGLARVALAQGHRVRGLSRNSHKLDPDIASKVDKFVTEIILILNLWQRQSRVSMLSFLPWTKLDMGDHETYDAYLSFKRLAELSSALKPIYELVGAILKYGFNNCKRDSRSALINIASQSLVYFGTGNEQLSFISVNDLSKFTLAAISDPLILQRGMYYTKSFRCTMSELADMYGKARGTEITTQRLGGKADLEAMLAGARTMISSWELNKYIDLVYGVAMSRGVGLADPSDCERWAGIVIPTGFCQWLQENPA
ncbi:Ff.00g117550.m01.CDS01 [Fusarium sp. VM40]|nr:Ff.00g117550.m01.CDS01 [Fusarium sp. VM40]